MIWENEWEEIGYRGEGKIEFIYEDGELYLIEMNKRIKVENKVKEEIKGIDIVNEKIRVEEGIGI